MDSANTMDIPLGLTQVHGWTPINQPSDEADELSDTLPSQGLSADEVNSTLRQQTPGPGDVPRKARSDRKQRLRSCNEGSEKPKTKSRKRKRVFENNAEDDNSRNKSSISESQTPYANQNEIPLSDTNTHSAPFGVDFFNRDTLLSADVDMPVFNQTLSFHSHVLDSLESNSTNGPIDAAPTPCFPTVRTETTPAVPALGHSDCPVRFAIPHHGNKDVESASRDVGGISLWYKQVARQPPVVVSKEALSNDVTERNTSERPATPWAVDVQDGVEEPKNPEKLRSPPPSGSCSSRTLTQISGNAGKAMADHISISSDGENEYSDFELYANLIEMTAPESIQAPTPNTSPQTQYLSSAKQKDLRKIGSSPMRPARVNGQHRSKKITVEHGICFSPEGMPLPFMRPYFPTPILDRSPIFGLTNQTTLSSCFRIGEALNAASLGFRNKVDAIIELYARVIESERQGIKQLFEFADLFTDRPPYLKGTYSLWKGVDLWDEDSNRFQGDEGRGKMCRVIGKIKRDPESGCEMNILSIWQCAWEDVGVAKSIVCS